MKTVYQILSNMPEEDAQEGRELVMDEVGSFFRIDKSKIAIRVDTIFDVKREGKFVRLRHLFLSVEVAATNNPDLTANLQNILLEKFKARKIAAEDVSVGLRPNAPWAASLLRSFTNVNRGPKRSRQNSKGNRSL